MKETEYLKCECEDWARDDGWFSKHHPNCEKYDPAGDAKIMITKLLRGIEAWAGDEDGVHPAVFRSYREAKIMMGEFDVLRKLT